MKKQRIKIEDIKVGARLRPNTNPTTVASIAASIEKLGLQNPISVYFADNWEIDGEMFDCVPVLVAGNNRREALLSLGPKYAFADCVVFDDVNTARLWEISENLHRSDLTALERDEHIAEWIERTQKKIEGDTDDIQSSQAVTIESKRHDGKGHRHESGINAAARELGVNRMDAHRAVKVAALAPEAKAIAREAGLDTNRAALLAVSKETTPEAQVAKVAEIAARKAQPRAKRDSNPADPNNAPAEPAQAAPEPEPYRAMSIKDIIAVVADDDAAMDEAFKPILAWPPHWRAALKSLL